MEMRDSGRCRAEKRTAEHIMYPQQDTNVFQLCKSSCQRRRHDKLQNAPKHRRETRKRTKTETHKRPGVSWWKWAPFERKIFPQCICDSGTVRITAGSRRWHLWRKLRSKHRHLQIRSRLCSILSHAQPGGIKNLIFSALLLKVEYYVKLDSNPLQASYSCRNKANNFARSSECSTCCSLSLPVLIQPGCFGSDGNHAANTTRIKLNLSCLITNYTCSQKKHRGRKIW